MKPVSTDTTPPAPTSDALREAQRQGPITPRGRLVLALVIAVFAISWAAVLFRLAPGLDPRTAAGWRLVIASTLLLSWLATRPRSTTPRPPRYRLHVGAAGLAYGVHFGTWVASLGLVPVALSVTAVTTTPLLLAVLGLVTGRDRPTRRLLSSLMLGFAGLALMALDAPGGEFTLVGIGLAVLGAAAMGIYLWLARAAQVSATTDTLSFAAWAAMIGGLLLLASAALTGAELGFGSPEELLVVALAAAIPQLVGHSLLTWAVGRTTPTRVALATLGEPVLAGLIAMVVLGELLGGLALLGGLITLMAVALALTERAGAGTPDKSAG